MMLNSVVCLRKRFDRRSAQTLMIRVCGSITQQDSLQGLTWSGDVLSHHLIFEIRGTWITSSTLIEWGSVLGQLEVVVSGQHTLHRIALFPRFSPHLRISLNTTRIFHRCFEHKSTVLATIARVSPVLAVGPEL